MSKTSRLRIDPSTNLPSIHSFGELSHFLREAVADEDTRHLSESMGFLATHIEAIVAGLRLGRRRDVVAPMLVDMLTVLRQHRQVVLTLDLTWRGLYEYAAYLQALNNFRVLIGQWLLDGGPRNRDLTVSAEDFELVAWRTLGDGMLLIDMYEQWVSREQAEAQDESPSPSAPALLTEPQIQRAVHWWRKLRL